MLLILSFLIGNIIVARYLEKRMHVASICHTVLFTILLVYILLLTDNSILVSSYKYLLGEKVYEILKELIAIESKGSLLRMSLIGVIEAVLVMIDTMVVSKYINRVAKKAVVRIKRRFRIKETKTITQIDEEETETKEGIIERKYINYCKFIIW